MFTAHGEGRPGFSSQIGETAPVLTTLGLRRRFFTARLRTPLRFRRTLGFFAPCSAPVFTLHRK